MGLAEKIEERYSAFTEIQKRKLIDLTIHFSSIFQHPYRLKQLRILFFQGITEYILY